MANAVEVTPEVLQSIYDRIDEIDGRLEDSQAAGKVKIRNDMRRTFTGETKSEEGEVSYNENGQKILNIREWVSKFSNDELVGVLSALNELVVKPVEKKADEYLTSKVPSDNQPKLSDEEQARLLMERKEKVEEYKMVRGILNLWKVDVSTIPVPTTKGVPRGPQAPEVFNSYQYFIDGTERTGASNKLSSIAASVMKAPTQELVELIKNKVSNFDEKNPPETFELEIPAPTDTRPNQTKTLKAVRTTSTELPSSEPEPQA